MKFEEVVVGVTYVVSIPKRLPSPTFEPVTGEVEATVLGIPLGHQAFAGGRPGRDSEKAEVLAKEKPWVLVQFVTRRARRLPENVGIGFETDESGDLVYDEITHLAKVKATRIGDTPEQQEMRRAAFAYALHHEDRLPMPENFTELSPDEKATFWRERDEQRQRLMAEFIGGGIGDEIEEFLQLEDDLGEDGR
jgi:hypothetical protein